MSLRESRLNTKIRYYVLRMQIMLRKSCHRTINNSKITVGGPCIPHPLGWGGRPQFDLALLQIIWLVYKTNEKHHKWDVYML